MIFSRLEPDDKLIIGFRKAPFSAELITIPNTANDGALISTGNENLSTVSAYTNPFFIFGLL